MWKPPVNFISLHYAYILTFGIWGLIVLYPYGNLAAVDAYFFGVSASTESGLNTVDVKALKTYQQLFLYFVPIITNLGFINIVVVVVRLYWFRKKLNASALSRAQKLRRIDSKSDELDKDAEAQDEQPTTGTSSAVAFPVSTTETDQTHVKREQPDASEVDDRSREGHDDKDMSPNVEDGEADPANSNQPARITFAPETNQPRDRSKTLYIPPPIEREKGHPLVEKNSVDPDDEDRITVVSNADAGPSDQLQHRKRNNKLPNELSIERVASSVFVLGTTKSHEPPRRSQSLSQTDLPYLSTQATIGRNSQFHNLTAEDRELLGGIEYRALKLLLKIIIGVFFGLHLFGAICLMGWIRYASNKYPKYLESQGVDKIWWAIYSAQTMVDNLGFTLTPDSMIHFQDAIFPLLVMAFLAYAGNTCYPCFLRLVIWTMGKVLPKRSSIQEPINFLLEHPRRCYTLLFPSRPTWILFGILFVLNFIDTVLIACLDLHNPYFAHLSGGERFVASLFQAASSRHTGTATFNLADVHPAVQFSLLVMMYISVFPIAISIRASNTYEEKSLGIYDKPQGLDDDTQAGSYVMRHLQDQLSFDLWYIFLGVFCICCAESDKITSEPANYSIFAILFEVVSAYGNVGLSIGYPTVLTSLCGKFTPFSKVVICAMMIRGRHRGLPVQLDRAIVLPSERAEVEDDQRSQISRIRSFGQDLKEKAGLSRTSTANDRRTTTQAA